MEALTGKQKKHLRGLGQRLEVGASVGKGGLSPGLVQGISGLLERHELVKVRLPAGPPQGRREMGQALADASGAANVGMVGRTLLLYRPTSRLEKDDRIVLP